MTEEEFLKQQGMSTQKIAHSLKFFCTHAYRDTKRRKCHFALALCSVFIVVLFSLVINTIVARGPIIFLKMAESNEGEIDGTVSPSASALVSNVNSNGTLDAQFLNFTRVSQLYGNKYNLSPRKSYQTSGFASDLNNANAGYETKATEGTSIMDGSNMA